MRSWRHSRSPCLVPPKGNRRGARNRSRRPSITIHGFAPNREFSLGKGYELEVIGNATPEGLGLGVRSFTPDGAVTEHETGLSWPASLVSLGHVALPFPPDDPVYGFIRGSGRDGIPSIGSWLLRGENGALTISLSSLTRLRSNPFWSLIDADVGTLVDADLGKLP